METLRTTSIRPYLAMLVAILAVLFFATWTAVRITTDRLLYQNATITAEEWAQYLARNVGDLEEIAAGETPSSASIGFLRTAGRSGFVFRYTIYNRYGYSMLQVDRNNVAAVNLSELDDAAILAVRQNRVIVNVQEGGAAGEPVYFAKAYVPVLIEGRPTAVVAASVDQTAERDRFSRAFLLAAASLCALTGASFAVPAIAWYRSTRERQRADRRIQFLAHHDALTGLANRTLLVERLQGVLATLQIKGGIVAAHFIDIDHFKQINDTFGHDGGDFLLGIIGKRLRSLTRAEDTVARLGGDEFIVVQTGLAEKKQAEAFAKRLVSVLSEPAFFNEQNVGTTFTVGIALAPVDGATAERLLKSADLALYDGKTAGRNCIRFFRPEMDEAMQKRVRLERLIRNAVERSGFEVHYQPMFEISNKRLIGFEALVRLPAPDGTLIAPMTFIPLAEEMHLIDPIGAWVLREACRTAMTWPTNLTVAVNLSPSQFESGTIENTVRAALQQTGLAPHRLELEITETLLLASSDANIAQLNRIKALGVSVVMDDFGTGYSSLSYLWKFPFDKIKIDRSFMENFERSGRDVETVVRTIVALGREMNMRVTVEGVESSKQVEFLHSASADQVQGFYFGRPMPASSISKELLALSNGAIPAAKPALNSKAV